MYLSFSFVYICLMISFYFGKKRIRVHTIKKLSLLIWLYCHKTANFSENLGNQKTAIYQLKSPKLSTLTSSPPLQPPPAIKSHRLISLCYSWSSAKSNPREIKILFWKVYVSLLYIFFYHKQVLSLAQLSLCLSMSVYIQQL